MWNSELKEAFYDQVDYVYTDCIFTGLTLTAIFTKIVFVRRKLIIVNVSYLEKNGVPIKRYNLTSEPQDFVASSVVSDLLRKEGADVLPITLVAARKLSTMNAQPSCILFSPTGCQLVVSELTTNRLIVFHADKDGTLSGPAVNNSSGVKPFGSCFLPSGLLLVTEAGPSAMSSYSVIPDGELRVISGSVPNGQMLACWVAPTRDGQYAYTSNTGSGSITTYRIYMNGTLSIIGSIYSTPEGMAMGAPIDCGVSWDGLNFYVLDGNQGSISVFYIGENGRLILLQIMNNVSLPTLGSQGLAVR